MVYETAPLRLGQYNRLEVIKDLDFGLYLDGYVEEILIPRVYVPEGTQIGQFLEVFIYRDSEDRLIATTLKPLAVVGEFAYLQVKDVSKLGVFMDWGLLKDLLVPFGNQHSKMGLGRYYMVYVYIDEETERIVATSKIDNHLEKDISSLVEGQEVSLIPYEYTDLGIKALIDKKYMGIIYKSEVFQNVILGVEVKGYIKKIRTDEKIDLALVKQSYDRIDNVKSEIFALLQSKDGYLPYTDKTDADIIYRDLQMSKKDFKKAIGGLYRESKIKLADDGIYIVK